MKCIALIVVGLSSAFLLGLSSYAADKTLADYKSLFEREMSKIESRYHISQKTALNFYGKNLALAKDRLKNEGDLEGTIAANQEIERFEEQKTVPQKPPDGFASLLVLVQKNYHDTLLAAEQVKSKNTIYLIKRYLIPLEGLKKLLVQQERLDEAREVADKIKKVTFVLADMESKMPEGGTKSAKPAATRPRTNGLPSSIKGLVLYYSFDKDEGEKAADKSGSGNEGKVHGTKWVANGKRGGAYQFDGRDDVVNAGHGSSLDITSNLTISAWIYKRKKTFGDRQHALEAVLGKDDGRDDTGRSYMIYLASTKVFFVYGKGSGNGFHTITSSENLCLEQWCHVVVVHKTGGGNKLYVDGKLVAEDTEGSPLPSTQNTDLIIGDSKAWEPWYFYGALDEIMIFDRALSESEIKTIYISQKYKT